MKQLLNHWKAYQNEVLPPDAPRVQIDETRNAYYAGASMVIMTMHQIGLDDGVSEDEGAEILQEMSLEILNWLEQQSIKGAKSTIDEATRRMLSRTI